ncbi:unnamed protein product [Symbiodinium sp. CCMP2456]|nr:unnamed protein product [Symbiodinium sp. CCMP2456]
MRFLVAHAPHRAHSAHTKRQWWQHLSHLCHTYSGGGAWVFLLDANCRVGSLVSEAIGGFQPDYQDESGECFHALLLGMNVFLPSTFEHSMFGEGGTLRQKRSGALDRSDFVGLPASWRDSWCQAWTSSEISAGHTSVDHFAAVVEVSLIFPNRCRATARPCRIDARAIAEPGNAEAVCQIIRGSPRPAWDVDASEHAAEVVDYLYRSLADAFPLQRRRMHTGYLSESTAAIHRVVSSLRHAVRTKKGALKQALLRCCMLAWRDASATLQSLFGGAWLWHLEIRFGLSCMLLHRYGLLLKRACREDRNRMYADFAEEITTAHPAAVHTFVKKVLKPKKYRRTCNDPLPTLFRADGTQCLTESEVTATWRDHFRVLEGGTATSAEALLSECRDAQAAFLGSDTVAADQMPTFLDLENALRHTAGRKAAGPDLIPPSLCRYFSTPLASLLWPLLLKTVCRASEAAGMKGLSSRPVHEIAEALGLDVSDMQELTRLIEQEAILPQQDAPQLLQELAGEFHRHTWFVLSGDTDMIATHRGTRPGGTLADVLFSLLFGQALRRRRSSALQAAMPSVPWTGARTLFPNFSAPAALCNISDIVYADDLCTPIVCNAAAELRPTVSAVVADTFDTLTPHALRINLGPTKTAAIMAHVGHGSRAARHEAFGVLKGRVPAWPESKGLQWLDLVSRYRHLGSIITYDGSLGAEVRHRLALARNAFRDGRRRLFACRDIPVTRRAVFFRSHVIATLTAGIGGWPTLATGEWRTFSGGLVGLYRQLLGLRAAGKWNYTTAQLLCLTGLSSPEAVLHTERLRLVGQLVRHGPDELWALLGHFSAYQQAIAAASDWALEAVRGTCELGPIASDWDRWACLMRDRPGQWKGLLKRADAWHALKTGLQADFDTVVRLLWEPRQDAPRAGLAGLEHGCLICGIAFPTRRQWGVHAQKVHGYRCPATRLALGRQCQACGSVYASQAKLRVHLFGSPRCLRFLELHQPAADDASSRRANAGHAQAPSVRGWGREHLPAAGPELCRSLEQALYSSHFEEDQDLYDEIVSHVAPLPVLRNTVRFWCESLECAHLRQLASDVLLVLSPEHVCTRVGGKEQEVTDPEMPFQPRLLCPFIRHPATGAYVLHLGSPCPAWISAWGLSNCARLPVDLNSCGFEAARCQGIYISFPPPPLGPCHFLTPPAGPLKRMREYCSWAASLLRVFCCLFRTAISGRPACLRIPICPAHLEPLTTWTSEAAAAGGHPLVSSFTLEFVSH